MKTTAVLKERRLDAMVHGMRQIFGMLVFRLWIAAV